MKKYFIIAAAALAAMCACTKNEVITPDQEIAFQTVNYAGQTKALEGSVFTYEKFGVYAWSAATQGTYFMDNETVSKQDGVWKPSTTYYWPKKANVDFISYYPREAAGSYVTIAPEKITYKDVNVANQQIDLMYADKVVNYGYADNRNGEGVTDGTEAQTKTVPAFFRHALAQVNVVARLAYRSKTIEENDKSITKYKWEINVTKSVLKNVHSTGSVELQLSNTVNPDLAKTYPWIACIPGTSTKTSVWKVSDALVNVDGGTGRIYTVKDTDVEPTYLFNEYYVVPQAVENQEVEITFSIKTYRGVNGAEPSEYLNETEVTAVAKLAKATNIPAWKMNQAATYTIIISPTAGPGGDGPEDDPDDPNLKDYEITFDPAVAGWDLTSNTVEIRL